MNMSVPLGKDVDSVEELGFPLEYERPTRFVSQLSCPLRLITSSLAIITSFFRIFIAYKQADFFSRAKIT